MIAHAHMSEAMRVYVMTGLTIAQKFLGTLWDSLKSQKLPRTKVLANQLISVRARFRISTLDAVWRPLFNLAGLLPDLVRVPPPLRNAAVGDEAMRECPRGCGVPSDDAFVKAARSLLLFVISAVAIPKETRIRDEPTRLTKLNDHVSHASTSEGLNPI